MILPQPLEELTDDIRGCKYPSNYDMSQLAMSHQEKQESCEYLSKYDMSQLQRLRSYRGYCC